MLTSYFTLYHKLIVNVYAYSVNSSLELQIVFFLMLLKRQTHFSSSDLVSSIYKEIKLNST